MTTALSHLFSEIAISGCTVKNRIVSTGHHTYLADGAPDDALIAYHEARARGGAGLIVTEITAVHPTGAFSSQLLSATERAHIAGFAKLAQACHRHGTKIFGQLFHPGREILSAYGGMQPVAHAPSAVPNERFHIMPKPLSKTLIGDIVEGFARNALHLAEAGYDGVEIVASHGYLPAQFFNPRTNLRDDDYGGDFERRLRFMREVIAGIAGAAAGLVIGMRISGDELDPEGLDGAEIGDICAALARDLDYVSVVAGTSASLGGSVHIVPAMGFEAGYVAPLAAAIKGRCPLPVIVTGRINQPQVADRIIARGEADLCGMTRALICDPAMPRKALEGQLDDIRACIACNQACIGRAHKGLPISCIQYPESGRELKFAVAKPAAPRKRILVVGGGPAGMKAAAVAASRSHEVTLYERERELGGQARLAQRLPAREEFGGIITNLAHEMAQSGVRVLKGRTVTRATVEAERPDAVILATGARVYRPALEGLESAHVLDAWEVLEGRANVGASVAIADWRADWIGLGLAERLARSGCRVTLCLNAAMAGESLQIYTRNHYLGRLHKLGVTIRTHLRLFGADEKTIFFQDTLTSEAVIIDEVDTLVLALGHHADDDLERGLEGSEIPIACIGDCVVPRTAEEAVYEGLVTGWEI